MDSTSVERQWESASVSLVDDMHFAGDADGYRIDLDSGPKTGGSGAGARPMRVLLLSLAGCTAMDVISILRKKRQQVTGMEVAVRGTRADQHPRVYQEIEIVYRVRGRDVQPAAVERAIELSEQTYCSVMAMLTHAAHITSRYEIEAET